VFADDADDTAQGRVLVGSDQLVFATDEWRQPISTTSVFDIVEAQEPPSEIRVGHEAEGKQYVNSAVFADRSVADEFVVALFRATLDDTAVRLRRSQAVIEGTMWVGQAGCRIIPERGQPINITDIETLRLSGDGEWILITCAGRGTADADPLAIGFRRKKPQHLAGRYLYWLHDRASPPARKAAGTGEIRVLLVDDDSGFVEIASVFLPRANEDIVVETASDVEGGLNRLSQSPPIHCIVSDYRMPEADGLSFLRAVRDVSSDIPFLMLTGRGDEDVAAEAVNNGVTGYLKKDTDTSQFTTLAERIETAVR
jgi:CheY-like chemotaxis protein